jgi:alpha-L-fucosidase
MLHMGRNNWMAFLTGVAGLIGLLAGPRGVAQNYVAVLPTDSEADIIRKAAHVAPSPRQFRWQELEVTAFFHFGINTFTDREWGDGKEDLSLFNPTRLDARQWVRTAKEAGIRQVILTAKHHDGFCLWPSKYTDHTIAHTPYRNGRGDIVREFAEACHEYGVGMGLYLSPWDRNSPVYGDSARYNALFLHWLTELLTQYGRVDEVWFDAGTADGVECVARCADWRQDRGGFG